MKGRQRFKRHKRARVVINRCILKYVYRRRWEKNVLEMIKKHKEVALKLVKAMKWRLRHLRVMRYVDKRIKAGRVIKRKLRILLFKKRYN